METFIAFCGLIGAWLLFAGPIYQAALELKEQDIEMDRIRTAGSTVNRPAEVSPWWWLIPPLKVYLESKRSKKFRHDYLKALLPEDTEALLTYMNKTTAWILVALGGLLIAVKETYEFTEQLEFSNAVFWIIVVLLGLTSVLHVILRNSHTKKILDTKAEIS